MKTSTSELAWQRKIPDFDKVWKKIEGLAEPTEATKSLFHGCGNITTITLQTQTLLLQKECKQQIRHSRPGSWAIAPIFKRIEAMTRNCWPRRCTTGSSFKHFEIERWTLRDVRSRLTWKHPQKNIVICNMDTSCLWHLVVKPFCNDIQTPSWVLSLTVLSALRRTRWPWSFFFLKPRHGTSLCLAKSQVNQRDVVRMIRVEIYNTRCLVQNWQLSIS